MSYQLIDGFDNYDSAHELWDGIGGTGSPTYSSTYARFPAAPNCVAQGIRFGSSFNMYKLKNLGSNQATLVFGLAVYFESLPSSGNTSFVGAGTGGFGNFSLAVGSNGSLILQEGYSGPTIVAQSGPGVVTAGRYYWIDIEITFNSVSGSVSVYLSTPAGGGALFAATGVNTAPNGNNFVNQVVLGQIAGTVIPIRCDDFHCFDSTGTSLNAILGEGTRVYTKMPNAAGYTTNWTPNGATANWQCVDDVPPDDDTTYVSAATFPQTDGYAVGLAGFTGAVNAVIRRSRIRKDDAGAHTFQNGVRSGSTNGLAAAVAVGSSYGWTDGVFVDDPNTSAVWTPAAADAASPVITAAS
jgi:hypothetical protein